MAQPLDIEIRQQLVRYLACEQSLSDFVAWFSPRTWNIHQARNPAAAELAYTIDLLLAEQSEGGWTEKQLRKELTPLVEQYSTNLSYSGGPIVTADNDSLNVENSISWLEESQTQSVGRPRELVLS